MTTAGLLVSRPPLRRGASALAVTLSHRLVGWVWDWQVLLRAFGCLCGESTKPCEVYTLQVIPKDINRVKYVGFGEWWTRGRRISRDLSRIAPPGKRGLERRQPVKRGKLPSVYRRGNALLFEMAIYSIHLGYELLLIDTARTGSRVYTFTLSQVGNGAALGL